MNNAELYDASQARVTGLLEGADPGVPVGACPGWTVRDLAAHLAGGLGDFVAGRFAVDDGDDFGERTVRERQDQDIRSSLVEWERNRAGAGDLLGGPMGGVLVAEVLSHEQDFRQALGRPRLSDDQAIRTGLERPLQEMDRKLTEAGGPTLALVVDGEQKVVGPGEPEATLTVSWFDLLRAVGGRRSREQVTALDWSGGAPEPYLQAFTLFGTFRDSPLDE